MNLAWITSVKREIWRTFSMDGNYIEMHLRTWKEHGDMVFRIVIFIRRNIDYVYYYLKNISDISKSEVSHAQDYQRWMFFFLALHLLTFYCLHKNCKLVHHELLVTYILTVKICVFFMQY